MYLFISNCCQSGKNYDLPEAVRRAKEYVYNTIKYANQLNVGKGFGPLNHFYFIN